MVIKAEFLIRSSFYSSYTSSTSSEGIAFGLANYSGRLIADSEFKIEFSLMPLKALKIET